MAGTESLLIAARNGLLFFCGQDLERRKEEVESRK